MMNPKIKTKWLAALRSGEYKQGRVKLEQTVDGEQRYCCLGVLAKCLGKKPFSRRLPNGEKEELPTDSFLNHCGLEYSTVSDLAGMNDGCLADGVKPVSFKKIATWIERNL